MQAGFAGPAISDTVNPSPPPLLAASLPRTAHNPRNKPRASVPEASQGTEGTQHGSAPIRAAARSMPFLAGVGSPYGGLQSSQLSLCPLWVLSNAHKYGLPAAEAEGA